MQKNLSPAPRHNHENGFFNVRDVLTILFKHKREIIVIFAFSTILSLIIPSQITPIYQAEASLMVKIGREHLYTSEVGDQTPKMGFDLQALIAPEIEILMSRDLSLKVLEVLGIDNIYPHIMEDETLTISPLEAALMQFQRNLSVYKSGKSNVIKVTFEHPNPQVSARVVNVLSELWKEKHLAIFSNPQTVFLEEQVQMFRNKLEQSENLLQAFKQEHGISSIADQRTLLLEQRQNLDTRLKSNEDQVEGSGSKIHALKNQLKTIPQYIPISTVKEEKEQGQDPTLRELLALRRKEQQFLGKYKEDSRMVTDIREEIARMEAYIKDQEAQQKDKQVSTVRNPVFQELQLELLNTASELTSLKAKRGVVSGQIEELESQIARLNRLEKQFDELQREVQKGKENVKTYEDKLAMANVSSEMNERQIANVSVIQAASVPVHPIKPKKSLILYFGVAFGLFSGMAWAFIAEFFKAGYIRPEQASLLNRESPFLQALVIKAK